MPAMSHEKVRAQYTCVGCSGPKSAGLLLCWPCHRKQKQLNAGQLYDYSPEIEAKLDKLEETLVKMRVKRAPPCECPKCLALPGGQ